MRLPARVPDRLAIRADRRRRVPGATAQPWRPSAAGAARSRKRAIDALVVGTALRAVASPAPGHRAAVLLESAGPVPSPANAWACAAIRWRG
jgi:hypothetical protein